MNEESDDNDPNAERTVENGTTDDNDLNSERAVENDTTFYSDDYDPYAERTVEDGTTDAESLFHMVKGIIGTGVLALPKGISLGGCIISVPFMFLVALLSFHAMDLTMFLKYIMCKRTRNPDLTVSIAFQMSIADGPPMCRCLERAGALFIDLSVIIVQLGVVGSYMIFVAENLGKLAGLTWATRTLLVCTFPAFVLVLMIPNLKKLAALSLIANTAIIIGLFIVLYYIFSDPFNLETVKAFGDIRDFPVFWAIVYYSYGSFGLSMSVERNALHPHKMRGWFGVQFWAIAISGFIYFIIGLFGYLRYGSEIKSTITLNLPSDAMATVVLSLFVLAIFLSFPVNLYIAFEILWKDYLLPRLQNVNRILLYEYIARTIFVLISFLFPLLIPFMVLYISLLSSIMLSFQMLILPAMFDIFVRYPSMGYGKSNWVIIKDASLFILGILSFIIGTLAAVSDIINAYEEGGTEK